MKPRTARRAAARAAGAAVTTLAGTALLFGGAARAQQGPPLPGNISVVMSGLDNPRGLVFGPDGALYVAEAGRGGNGPSIVAGSGATQSYGPTSALSRYANGVQQRVVTGLPSLAGQSAQNGATPGASATGLHDIAFDPSSGDLFGIVGFGANPALRQTLISGGAPGADFGQLVRFNLGAGTWTNVADLTSVEAALNPDGQDLNSNPYGLAARPGSGGGGGGFVVADAGANALFGVNGAGSVSLVSSFPVAPNPLPFGRPFYQAVPTAVALGPDGAYYVGQLTGAPYVPGAANVFRVDPQTGQRTVAVGGFTNIVDLTFGPDGGLYVLQLTTNGLASPTGPGTGALIRVDTATGARTTIADQGLTLPGGVAVGSDGAFYVSNLSVVPGGGQVLRITPAQAIPEPGTAALLGLAVAPALAGTRALRRRARREAAA